MAWHWGEGKHIRRNLLMGLALIGLVGCGSRDPGASERTDVATSFVTVAEQPAESASTVDSTEMAPATTGAPDVDAVADASSTDDRGDPMPLLTARTTDSGFTLMVHDVREFGSLEFEEVVGDQAVPGWEPPFWCNPDGRFVVTAAHEDATAVAQGSWFEEPPGGLEVSTFPLRLADDVRLLVVVAQATGATSATAHFTDGTVDTAPVENGFAVLAAAIPAGVSQGYGLTVNRNGPSSKFESDTSDDDRPREACVPPVLPPPSLPPAGEQPADPVAAEAAVRAAFATVYAFEVRADDSWLQVLDSDEGIVQALEEFRNGPYADAREGASANVNEVVFTSPTEAWFTYDLFANDNHFDDRFGIAHLVEGQWRVARSVLCQDLALAGVECQPPAVPIVPHD